RRSPPPPPPRSADISPTCDPGPLPAVPWPSPFFCCALMFWSPASRVHSQPNCTGNLAAYAILISRQGGAGLQACIDHARKFVIPSRARVAASVASGEVSAQSRDLAFVFPTTDRRLLTTDPILFRITTSEERMAAKRTKKRWIAKVT